MQIDKEKAIFLLGGHDLEMITIRDILKENNISFEDKKLNWGAKLSDYKDVIEANKEKTVYAVELEEDMELPSNYYRIDHHNDCLDREASILQVLKLLNIEPNEVQKRIAANDSRYIPGMQCIGSTNDQIHIVRENDRRAQNVPIEDDAIGAEDVKNRKVENSIDIVYAHTSHFSTITDSLYFDVDEKERKTKTIIYTEIKIVFYGFLLTDLKKLLKKFDLEESSYYFGGGEEGFIGIKDNVLDKKQISKLVELCISNNKEQKESEIYSYHTFMLPFRFDKIMENINNTYRYYQKQDISKRVSIDESMKSLLESDGWEHKPFSIQNNFDYNEYAYFYSFIRDTIYNKDEFKEGNTSYFFEKEYEGGEFNIKIKEKTYELELEGLSLRMFETGIAIFSIEVSNRKFSQSKMNDILKINDFARRIYAPYLGKWDTKANWTQSPKDSQLPEYVKVVLPNGTVYEDDFCQEYIGVPDDIKISKYILKLLGKNTFTTHTDKIEQYLIQPVIDDRMFVLSWYGNDVCSKNMKDDKYIDDPKWYEYVFVDGDGITVHNKKMQKELIVNSTYDRWMNYKNGLTLFGLSRYSFVCLTNGLSFNRDVLSLPHMKTMYFQMFTLLLATRASTLRFSEEVTALSDIKNETDDNFSEKVSSLYKYYIRFVNKIYFREVTAQEQGIELYDKASELMNIERDVKSLDEEIAELHTYVSMKAEEKQVIEAEKREQRLETISKLGAVFLPPALLSGILGMNSATYMNDGVSIVASLFAIAFSAFLGFVMVAIEEKRSFLYFLTVLFMMFTILGTPYVLKKDPQQKQPYMIKLKTPIECVLKDDQPIVKTMKEFVEKSINTISKKGD